MEGVTCEVFKAPNYHSESGQMIKAFLDGEKIEFEIEELFHLNRLEVGQLICNSDAQVVLVDRWHLDALVYSRFR